ncbi:MAG: hypothetical protein IJU70_09120 [Lentisphaeria bacterium]|nr:hypothetical protein [Lentisphaeria bacterium]
MPFLRMKGVRCASLEEFRNKFDFTNAKDYLRQGRLSRWVRDLGENDLADELDELKDGEYSDQTLLDNFVGIFGLNGEKARLPEKEAPVMEEKALPAVPASASELPAVLTSGVENSEECAHADSEICFRDSHMSAANQSVTMRNVKGNSPAALHQYMDNKAVLEIIRKIILGDLPGGLHETFGYQIEIKPDSRFMEDLGFREPQFRQLEKYLNEMFRHDYVDECLAWGLLYQIPRVGDLLDRLCESSFHLRSYTDDAARQLLDAVAFPASGVEHAEECAYADSEICFRDSRAAAANQSVTMRNVEGSSPAAIHQYMDNKVALKIIREIILGDLPEGLHKKYRFEITADSLFGEVLGFRELQFSRLAEVLNEKFCTRRFDGYGGLRINYSSFAKVIGDVGVLLDYLKEESLHLKSYSDDEAKQLLVDGF